MSGKDKKDTQHAPKRQDETLRDNALLTSGPESGSFGARFFDFALDMCCVAGLDGFFKRVNAAFESTLGYGTDVLLSKPFIEFVHPDDVEATLFELSKLNKGVLTLHFENRYLCGNGGYKWLAWKAYPVPEEGLIYAVARDMTLIKNAQETVRNHNEKLEAAVELRTVELQKALSEKTAAEAQVSRQLRRLRSLRKIDQAIAGSPDLRVVMDVFLDQVTSQLRVDAAAVFLCDGTGTLAHLADRGFDTDSIRATIALTNKGTTAKCVQERTLIHIPDLAASSEFQRNSMAAAEGFVFYCGAPLLAKGKVTGVLEVYHREPFEIDEEWVAFLEMLAGQGAIGVESTRLFERLERSHTELQTAYDATLEGWVAALDLRDHETEGHTQRVTSLTVALARMLGFSEEDVQHVRRGALLHDIGKIGVPDKVLLKPGKLTDEELAEMRMHPVYAHEWLSSIAYLRPALDIPYCHHEKFDGSGYPRGLAGAAIPLAARLFAVVDVWDALSHDRVYRKAWPRERVLAHLQEHAGSHFDPMIVNLFLELLKNETGLRGDRHAA
jgi:PAS domain S-box-containing protein